MQATQTPPSPYDTDRGPSATGSVAATAFVSGSI